MLELADSPRRLHLFISRKIEMNLLRTPFNRSMPAAVEDWMSMQTWFEKILRKETEIPVVEETRLNQTFVPISVKDVVRDLIEWEVSVLIYYSN